MSRRCGRLEPEHAVDQERKSAGVPQLRCVGARIGSRTARLTARIPADALRNAIFRILLRQVEERVCDLQGPRVEPKTTQAEGNRRLFNSPNRAEVVTQWVVRPVGGRQRPDPPPTEHIWRKHAPDHARKMLVADDAAW